MAFRNTAIVAGTILTGVLAYAVYFDHKRQSDPAFRKSLKKNNKKVEQTVKQEEEAGAAARIADLKNALEEVKKSGELPTDLEEKESFFMHQVALGESLCASESTQVEAAIAFWKALKVYPQPQDLIGIYEKTVPKATLQILAELIALDGGHSPAPKASTDDNIE
ncbi:Protein import receptor MAS20-like protein [Penicillium sp. DV-2018c]|nr:Protein import receptor MAS20-like protein [Penicillium sp. DV-2018c]KAJ5560764.1 Protein import receptor MAS20-like protein [Penicillium sp. DV-2018c]